MRSNYIKRLTSKLPPGSKLPPLSTAAELILGAVAGALAQIFTIPVSVIATRQQVGRPEGPAGNGLDKEVDDSFLGVAREIIDEEGVTGLWLGIKPGLVLTVNPAITYGAFERVKSLVLIAQGNVSTKMGPWLSFLIGALSKTLATVVRFLCALASDSDSFAIYRLPIRISWRRYGFRPVALISRTLRSTTTNSPIHTNTITNTATMLARWTSWLVYGRRRALPAGIRYVFKYCTHYCAGVNSA